MPEGIEVEYARRLVEERALRRKIAGIDAPDAWYLKRGLTAAALEPAITGHRLTAARRRGKLLLLDTDRAGPTLGLHLGMSGRVLIDDHAAGDPLIYSSNIENPLWHPSRCASPTAARSPCATRAASGRSSSIPTRNA